MRSIVFGIALLLSAVPGYSMTFEECANYTNEINKTLPSRVDATTRAITTVCLPRAEKNILVFSLEIDTTDAGKIDKDKFAARVPKIQNMLCTYPNFSELIKVVDFRYVYRLQNGVFLGQFDFSEADC
mgnify:FL=1